MQSTMPLTTQKQERKLTRAEGARIPRAPTNVLSFLFFVAREKRAPNRCNGQKTPLVSMLEQ